MVDRRDQVERVREDREGLNVSQGPSGSARATYAPEMGISGERRLSKQARGERLNPDLDHGYIVCN